MNANIIKTQIFHKMTFDFKGHGKSHNVLLAKLFLAHSIINRFENNFV